MHDEGTAESGNALEDAVREAVDYAIPVIEAIGAAVVLVGALLAIAYFVLSAIGVREASFDEIRLTLGRHLALGLEFQLGSDILATAVSPTWDDLGKLAAIATIRTVLNYFLQRELAEEAREVREQRRGRGTPGGVEEPGGGR